MSTNNDLIQVYSNSGMCLATARWVPEFKAITSVVRRGPSRIQRGQKVVVKDKQKNALAEGTYADLLLSARKEQTFAIAI